ncbi:MAG: hypothetical protein FJW91_01430 [Actinobacteria bacterium]|nr:hypothetical protein [Actinomycetota bacterium]
MHLTAAACKQLLPPTRQDLIKCDSNQVFDFKIDDASGVLIFESDEQFFIAPYVKGLDYQRAQAADGVSAKLLSNPLPAGLSSTFQAGDYKKERMITAEQSNQSIVVDDQVIVKWQLVAKESVDARKQELLSRNGFTYLPKLLGNIYWDTRLIASVNKYIPGAQDGWKWCVDLAKDGDAGRWVENLALLTKQMHESLDGLTHGDLHVGQILKTDDSDMLWVIDFEGDPLGIIDDELDQLRDIASMCVSFFHVGAVAIKYGSNTTMIKEWIIATQDKFLAAYFGGKRFDLSQLQQKMRVLEDRELEYANKFLNYWRYAPEFAIGYMQELGYGSN